VQYAWPLVLSLRVASSSEALGPLMARLHVRSSHPAERCRSDADLGLRITWGAFTYRIFVL